MKQNSGYEPIYKVEDQTKNTMTKKQTKTKPPADDIFEKIVYFHDFNSSPECDTVKALQAYFGEMNVITPFYDYANPHNAFEYLNRMIALLWFSEQLVFAGTGLGGFWANYFAEKWKLPTLLINPTLNPAQSLIKRIGNNKNQHTGEIVTLTKSDVDAYANYKVEKDTLYPSVLKMILLGGRDNADEIAQTRAAFPTRYIETDETEGHHFKNQEKIVKLVGSTIYTGYYFEGGDGD